MIFQNGLKSWEGWTPAWDDKAANCFAADFSWSGLCQIYFQRFVFPNAKQFRKTHGWPSSMLSISNALMLLQFCFSYQVKPIFGRHFCQDILFESIGFDRQNIFVFYCLLPQTFEPSRVMSSSWRFLLRRHLPTLAHTSFHITSRTNKQTNKQTNEIRIHRHLPTLA